MSKALFSSLMAAALMSGTASAQVTEANLSSRVATSIGSVIAAQGNIAFQEVRDELKRNLLKTLKPFLPKPAPVRSGSISGGENLPDLLQTHDQAHAVQ